ncbi:MAG: PIN domain-containing protein [Ignavibacteriaceae bacterium]|nr:PIN domain-containing protein [Ignavibacteriaceae bacterium]NUM69295.1 PIN domain-containing protein [Ignavibacteriaceae bacterium]
MEIILDSDVIISLLKGERIVTGRFMDILNGNRVFVSAVTVSEIMSISEENEAAVIEKLFELLNVLEVNREIGKLAGKFLRESRFSDVHISTALIAASSAYHRFPVWTLKRDRYPMLEETLIVL